MAVTWLGCFQDQVSLLFSSGSDVFTQYHFPCVCTSLNAHGTWSLGIWYPSRPYKDPQNTMDLPLATC